MNHLNWIPTVVFITSFHILFDFKCWSNSPVSKKKALHSIKIGFQKFALTWVWVSICCFCIYFLKCLFQFKNNTLIIIITTYKQQKFIWKQLRHERVKRFMFFCFAVLLLKKNRVRQIPSFFLENALKKTSGIFS